MVFEGKLEKLGQQWLISIPLLDVMTQAGTKSEAYEMLEDLILSFLDYHKGLKFTFSKKNGSHFYAKPNTPNLVLPFVLQRLRQISGLSLMEVRDKLNLKSRNSYARYEQAECDPSFAKLNKMLDATGYDVMVVPKVGVKD